MRVNRRAIAQEYVRKIRARTFCVRCGAQPIDWHHFDHVARPRDRITLLVNDCASLARIDAEIKKCEALCRTCHMIADGRLTSFATQASQRNKYVPARPCVACGQLAKPTRRGYCGRCYDRVFRAHVRKAARAARAARAAVRMEFDE